MKEYITKITSNGIMTNKSLWKTMRPFLTYKGFISGNEISLFEREKVVNNKSIVAEILNLSYINVVEKTSRIKPTSVLDQEKKLSKTIDFIVEKYSYTRVL